MRQAATITALDSPSTLDDFRHCDAVVHASCMSFTCCRSTGQHLASLAEQMLEACHQRNSGSEQLSYNVVLTSEYLQMVPRRAETSGEVSVNALGAAGTFFVKKQQQLEYLEQRTPSRVLVDVGFEW